MGHLLLVGVHNTVVFPGLDYLSLPRCESELITSIFNSVSDCASLPSALRAGCQWRFNWFKNADNPSVIRLVHFQHYYPAHHRIYRLLSSRSPALRPLLASPSALGNRRIEAAEGRRYADRSIISIAV